MDEVVNAVCSTIESEKTGSIDREIFEIQPRVFNFEAHHLANKVRRGEVSPDSELRFQQFREKML